MKSLAEICYILFLMSPINGESGKPGVLEVSQWGVLSMVLGGCTWRSALCDGAGSHSGEGAASSPLLVQNHLT